MLAMLRHVVYEGLRKRRVRRTWFIHGNRTAAERPFSDELSDLVQSAKGAVRVIQVLSEPSTESKEGSDFHAKGFIDLPLLKAVLPFDDFDFYLCGPPVFMQSLYEQLRSVRVPNENIFAEAFGPAGLKRDNDLAMPSASSVPVAVLFSTSGKEARWTPDSGSLLELAEARGMNPPYSCRSGTCGSCRHTLTQGSVTYANKPAAAFSDTEVLLCQALPMAGSKPLIIDA